jgi:hypothetical protein
MIELKVMFRPLESAKEFKRHMAMRILALKKASL